MAISQFEVGKRYKLNTNKIHEEEEPKPFFSEQRKICCCDLKLITRYNQIVNIDGYCLIVFDTNKTVYIKKYNTTQSQSSSLLYFDYSDLNSLNFEYGYILTPEGSGLEEYVNKVTEGKRALVSIYDNLSSKQNKWVDLPCPSDYSGSASTLVDSGRNTQGQVVGSVIASDVAKIELKWNFLTVDQYKKIAQLFEPAYYGGDTSVFMRVCAFYDVIKGGWNGSTENAPDIYNNKCKIFYPSDRKVQFAKIVLNDNGSPKGYSGVSLNLIDTGKYYGE